MCFFWLLLFFVGEGVSKANQQESAHLLFGGGICCFTQLAKYGKSFGLGLIMSTLPIAGERQCKQVRKCSTVAQGCVLFTGQVFAQFDLGIAPRAHHTIFRGHVNGFWNVSLAFQFGKDSGKPRGPHRMKGSNSDAQNCSAKKGLGIGDSDNSWLERGHASIP